MGSADGEHRFFRIQLESGSTAWPTDLRKLIIVLAHELWHEHEAVRSGVSSREPFERFFRSIGQRMNGSTYETAAAQGILPKPCDSRSTV